MGDVRAGDRAVHPPQVKERQGSGENHSNHIGLGHESEPGASVHALRPFPQAGRISGRSSNGEPKQRERGAQDQTEWSKDRHGGRCGHMHTHHCGCISTHSRRCCDKQHQAPQSPADRSERRPLHALLSEAKNADDVARSQHHGESSENEIESPVDEQAARSRYAIERIPEYLLDSARILSFRGRRGRRAAQGDGDTDGYCENHRLHHCQTNEGATVARILRQFGDRDFPLAPTCQSGEDQGGDFGKNQDTVGATPHRGERHPHGSVDHTADRYDDERHECHGREAARGEVEIAPLSAGMQHESRYSSHPDRRRKDMQNQTVRGDVVGSARGGVTRQCPGEQAEQSECEK